MIWDIYNLDVQGSCPVGRYVVTTCNDVSKALAFSKRRDIILPPTQCNILEDQNPYPKLKSISGIFRCCMSHLESK